MADRVREVVAGIDEVHRTVEDFPHCQPLLQESCGPILHKVGDQRPYQAYNDATAFRDIKPIQAEANELAESVARLDHLARGGDDFAVFIYTYRGITKTLPQIQASDQHNKAEIYQRYYDVLEPEIQKVRGMFHWADEASHFICSIINDLLKPELKDAVRNEQLLFALMKLLDKLLVVDTMKNSKGALNNDFSFYKRALDSVQHQNPHMPDQTLENTNLCATQTCA